MSLSKITGCLCMILALFVLFTSCSSIDDSVNYEEYEKDNIVEISINNTRESYLFICTKDYQLITYDKTKNKRVVSECKAHEIRYINAFLNYIAEDDTNNIEFNPGVDDFWMVNLHIDEKEYLFTYGASKNPYVNMLVEVIIGCSDYKIAQEALVPFPSTFR